MWDMDLEESSIMSKELCAETTETAETKVDSLSEKAIIPQEGVYLGLDISQNSSGICLYDNGVKETHNSSLSYDVNSPFAEAKMRRELEGDLLEVIGGRELDLVVIEDVFDGNNPEVVRKLYALNTAIDELILDGKVHCKRFARVPNGTWKRWLSLVDTEGVCRGFNDKERIQYYLEMLGVSEEGEGYQDRLDATGMLIGYFLRKSVSKSLNDVEESEVRVSFSDLEFAYEADDDLVRVVANYSRGDDLVIRYIDDTKITKKVMLDYLSSDFATIFITSSPIRLGLLAKTLNMSVLDDGGFFGFWVAPKALKKYKKRVKRIEVEI